MFYLKAPGNIFSNLAAEICPHLAARSFVKSQTDEFVRMNPFYLNLPLIHVDVSLLKQEGALFKPLEADYHLNITAYCSIWVSLNWKEVYHHTKKYPAIKEPPNRNNHVLIYLNPSRS